MDTRDSRLLIVEGGEQAETLRQEMKSKGVGRNQKWGAEPWTCGNRSLVAWQVSRFCLSRAITTLPCQLTLHVLHLRIQSLQLHLVLLSQVVVLDSQELILLWHLCLITFNDLHHRRLPL